MPPCPTQCLSRQVAGNMDSVVARRDIRIRVGRCGALTTMPENRQHARFSVGIGATGLPASRGMNKADAPGRGQRPGVELTELN